MLHTKFVKGFHFKPLFPTRREEKAIRQLDQELRVIELVKQSQDRLNILETMMQGEYLRHLIRGMRNGDDIKADFHKLNISLDPDLPFFVVLGVIFLPESQDSYVAHREAGLAIKFLAESFFQDRMKQLGVLDRYNDLLWVIQAKPPSARIDPSSDPTIQRLVRLFELIGKACTDSLGVSITITMTNRAIDWDSLPNVYDQLRQLQNARVGDGMRMVQVVPVEKEVKRFLASSSSIRSSLEKIELLTIHLESGRRKEFMELFREIEKSVINGNISHRTLVFESYYSIASALLFYINRMQLYDYIQTKKLLFIDYHPSLVDAFAFLRKTAESLFAFRDEGRKKRTAQAIEQICQYIEEHLKEDLSLTRLAHVFHFNPSYLSRLFKHEKGVKLSEYIEHRRASRAKELLKKSNLKIGEIGSMVGYDAPHSFTRFFKRMTGVTPNEYRDKARET